MGAWRCSAAVVAAALAAAALAQDSGQFDGRWRGHYVDRNGKDRPAELLIAGQAGKWVYVNDVGKFGGPCLGPQMPATITADSGGQLRVRIDGESVIKGCAVRIVTLKPGTEPDTLSGSFQDNGHEVTLKRR